MNADLKSMSELRDASKGTWAQVRAWLDVRLSDPANILVVVVLIAAIAVWNYIATFGLRPVHDVASWGQFGDFIGGLLNPVLGFFTLVAVIATVGQNQKLVRAGLVQAATATSERAFNASQDALPSAIAGFDASLEHLQKAGKDRRKWISAARLLATAQRLRVAITEKTHLDMLEIVVEQKRELVAQLLGYSNTATNAAFFYGAPLTPEGRAVDTTDDAARHSTRDGNVLNIPEEAIHEFWRFAQFPPDYRDPLSRDFTWHLDHTPTRNSWPGLFDSLRHRREWMSANGNLVRRPAPDAAT